MRKLLAFGAIAVLAGCETLPPGFLPPPAAEAAAAETAGAAATAQTPGPVMTPEQELLEADRALGALAQQKGVGAAMAQMADPTDGFVLTEDGMFQGPTAVAAGLSAITGDGPLFWQADRAYVSKSGDFGMTSGSYVQVLIGQQAAQGRYVTVWRKDADGLWRVLADVPVAKKPPAPPPSTKKKK